MKRKLGHNDYEFLMLGIIILLIYLVPYILSPNNIALLIEFTIILFIYIFLVFILKRTDIRFSSIICLIFSAFTAMIVGFVSSLPLIEEMKLKTYIANVSKVVENNNLEYTDYRLTRDGIFSNDSVIYQSNERLYKLPYVLDVQNTYLAVADDGYYIKVETDNMCAIKDFYGNLSITREHCPK